MCDLLAEPGHTRTVTYVLGLVAVVAVGFGCSWIVLTVTLLVGWVGSGQEVAVELVFAGLADPALLGVPRVYRPVPLELLHLSDPLLHIFLVWHFVSGVNVQIQSL